MLARLALAFVLIAAPAAPIRTVHGNVLTSSDLPKLTLTLDKRFEYVGRAAFNIRNIADGERFVWVQADSFKHVQKLFIVQFEGFMPDIDSTYRFELTNPVRLGSYDYRHNIWFWDNYANYLAHKSPDADSSYDLLRSKGYQLDAELAMSRFATIVGDDKRHELILFYIESLKVLGHKLEEFPEDKPASAEQKKIEQALDERSRKAFSVND
jgi:hypothetical protein